MMIWVEICTWMDGLKVGKMMIWAEICTWMDGLKVGKISRHLFKIARRT